MLFKIIIVIRNQLGTVGYECTYIIAIHLDLTIAMGLYKGIATIFCKVLANGF